MYKDIEAVEETLEILSDRELMAILRQSMQEVLTGDVEDFEDVLVELGWTVADN